MENVQWKNFEKDYLGPFFSPVFPAVCSQNQDSDHAVFMPKQEGKTAFINCGKKNSPGDSGGVEKKTLIFRLPTFLSFVLFD